MKTAEKEYLLPEGYNLLQTTLHSFRVLRDPIKFIQDSMDKFGGTYYASLTPKRKLIITQDADFINYVLRDNHKNYHKSELTTERVVKFFGNGLLMSNGAYWLRQRRLLQPAFHRDKLQGLYRIMISSIEASVNHFPEGKSIDVFPLLQQLSFRALLQSLFDIALSDEMISEMSCIFTELQDFLFKDINQPLRKFFYPVTKAEEAKLNQSHRLREIISGIIADRRKSCDTYNDLLDILLNSRYEDTGEAMTDEQVMDELLILIFAGHETTGNALSWLLYLLSTNLPVQEKLSAELEKIDASECLTNEYLKATINEGMRLYPAAWMTERVTLEDDKYNGYLYPKGTIVIPFFYGMHRDEKHWPEANTFNPERFIKDGKVAKANAFFPFGAGPRLCIGNNFALAEMCFFTTLFLQRFQVLPTGQVPEMKPLITLRPDKVLVELKKTFVTQDQN
jgi:cytochrome P450